jgi:membrane-bound metal-dependent hydrolase YbcI (DUF457 family)
MKLPEHVALSYLLAQLGPEQTFGSTGTVLMIAAGVLPDLDGLSILGGWRCHDTYHRVLGHGLPVTLFGPALLAALGAWLLGPASFGPLWAWLQLSLVTHLATDLLFYCWPTQLAWPVSHRTVMGLGLVQWNDLVPTLLLYGGCLVALAQPRAAAAAAVSLLGLAGYLIWRARRSPGVSGWSAWLAGGWARRAPRVWRWLTGDFIP